MYVHHYIYNINFKIYFLQTKELLEYVQVRLSSPIPRSLSTEMSEWWKRLVQSIDFCNSEEAVNSIQIMLDSIQTGLLAEVKPELIEDIKRMVGYTYVCMLDLLFLSFWCTAGVPILFSEIMLIYGFLFVTLYISVKKWRTFGWLSFSSLKLAFSSLA